MTPTTDPLILHRRFSVAPMMDWTDRHARYFYRLMTRQTLLYTEMVTTGAILYGHRPSHLEFNACEHPVALQLGGSKAEHLAQCALIGQEWGYDEINLNCGCPSDRVQEGAFGVCLMKTPDLIAELVCAMKSSVHIPVTVKSRIGVDDIDSYDQLAELTEKLIGAGVDALIVHARKAWLHGLSPKENREIPPLDYARVFRLKGDFPDLQIILNGGIETIEQAREYLKRVDGVMMGRAAYKNPWQLTKVDNQLFAQDQTEFTREQILEKFILYMEFELDKGTRLSAMTRHILGLYQGFPGGRRFRRVLSEQAHKPGAGIDVVRNACEHFLDKAAV